MAEDLVLEKWSGEINTVKIGALKNEGGTRSNVISVGGQKSLPILFKEGAIPNKPVIAYEIFDTPPEDWPDTLMKEYASVSVDPVAWAKFAVEKLGAQLLSLRLQGAHPDQGNKSPEECAETVKKVLKAVSVPLIVVGCGDDEKDNLVLPVCSFAAKNERCLFGSALQDNYKTLAVSVLGDGHSIIAESPIDINIAKQLNILISDMGLPLDRIVMNPTIGALGYGLEYAYSIMERARLAALSGDKTLSAPFICFVGQESWRAKEAKATLAEFPSWGVEAERGISWEIVTSIALIQSGADILVMRHPTAIKKVSEYINNLFKQ